MQKYMNCMELKRQVGQYKPKRKVMRFYRIREGSTNVNGEMGNLPNSLVLGDAPGPLGNKTS